MKIRKILLGALFTASVALTSCTIDNLVDPNNPSVDGAIENATLSDIQNLVYGCESGMRNRINNYYDGVNMIGREYWRFSKSDPRFTGDILGKNGALLDNNTFYTISPYFERLRTIRNAYILSETIKNAKALTDASQRNNADAYASTIIAHQMLENLKMQYQNGIRTDVSDPDNLRPFQDYTTSLRDISDILNAANAKIDASSSLPFSSTVVTDANNLKKLNRALAARVAVYKEDWAGALTALTDASFALTDDLNSGFYMLFSTAGGDQTCPLYFPNDASGEVRLAHPSFIADAEAGDQRVAHKTNLRTTPETLDGLTGDYDFSLYKSLGDDMPIIRNEELALIMAEANIQLNNTTDAVSAINRVRNAAGLANYTGATDANALINEMLKQRRYSLFGEGQRWVDMRRYNKLNELAIDRAGDIVHTQYPRPANEN